MEKNDIVIDYSVSKVEGSFVIDMKAMVQSIYTYIQTHEIYFKYEPSFVEGVLIFGIVGFKDDHEKLLSELGQSLKEHGVELKVLLER